MAILTIPNTFVNGTPAIASEVNANFDAVKVFSEALSTGVNINPAVITSAQLTATGVVAGVYTYPTITVDTAGRVTVIASGVAPLSSQSDQHILATQVFS